MENASTRIDVFDPRNLAEPIASVSVPGEVTKEQISKSLRVGVTIVVALGGRKKKRKTFVLSIQDEGLKRALDEYVNNLLVKMTLVSFSERSLGELKMGEIRLEE